jgi:SAM-dependent MidA family methyltransferase
VLAHEWLDDVPCHVVEVDDAGVARMVHVDPVSGVESLGDPVDSPGVPALLRAWLDEWWPLDPHEPGTRAEVGTSRDRAWADLVSTVAPGGMAVAVDYGHTRGNRPPHGSLRSYLHGREVDVLPDGSRDVTAHVAVDSVASAVGGVVHRQRDALAALGVSAARPRLTGDPAAYAHGLAAAGRAAELMAVGGFGDFYWIVSGGELSTTG